MGVKVVRPSGRKDWYIQVCEGGRRQLRHVGSFATAHEKKRMIEAYLNTTDNYCLNMLPNITEEQAKQIILNALKGSVCEDGSCEVCGYKHIYALENHHLIPRYMAGRNRKYRDEKIRLCSNCHSIAHRKWGQNNSYDGPTDRTDFIEKLKKLLI